MKKIMFLIALFAVTFPHISQAQSSDALGNYTVGTATDTAKPNTTKSQKIKVMGSHDKGITVQYFLDQITDTITGYASVWVSIDNITYVQHPTADSIAISAATDCKKIWYLNTQANGNPVNWIDIRTRCPSNTTDATGKAKLNTKLLTY
jgi:hypothetical protein